jgi:predicted NBD/HSP70 family sugar kinase
MTAATSMFAGVDIGGTGVKVGIVTGEGKVVARALETYEALSPKPEDVVNLAAAVLHKLLAKVGSCGDVAIAMPLTPHPPRCMCCWCVCRSIWACRT